MERDIQLYNDVIGALPGDYYNNIADVFDNDIFHDKHETCPNENIYDIRDFGAVSDTDFLSTDAINNAIKAAHETKGTVLVKGNFRSGTIYMESDVTLFVTEGSVIYGSRNPDKYDGALVIADGKENIMFTGGGGLNGEGECFVGLPNEKLRSVYPKIEANFMPPILMSDTIPKFENSQRLKLLSRQRIRGLKMDYKRQKLVEIRNCKNVIINNFVLSDSAEWTLNLLNSDKVHIEKLIINDNRHVANADGIDINGTSNCIVKDSFVAAADDAIVLKNTSGHKMHNITVHRCVMQSVANCFKIGTETSADISDVTVMDSVLELPDIYPGACSGVSIESADGVTVSNIDISDIKMLNVQCPIFISANNRMRFGAANPEWSGKVKNVTIKNVEADMVEAASVITGASDAVSDGKHMVKAASKFSYCKDIVLKNIVVKYRESTEHLNPVMACENTIDNEPTIDTVTGAKLYPTAREYPEYNRLGDVPACGIFIRHTKNVVIRDFFVTPRKCNEREKIVWEKV